jgi:putative hydrolase of the HAD superfamily
MPLRAIGFDIDGTLYSAPRLYAKLFLKGIVRLKLLLAFNEVRHDIRELGFSPEYRALNISSIEGFHRFQADMTAKRLKADPESTNAAIEKFFYTASIDPFSSIPLYPGVVSLLDDLRSRGYRLGALSDFPCERKLELFGIADKFDAALTSEETGLVKPDRASFDLMAKRLGVPNDEILYVGNSEKYDVAGALNAGMRAAIITADRRAKTAAEFSFFDFADLGRYILKA